MNQTAVEVFGVVSSALSLAYGAGEIIRRIWKVLRLSAMLFHWLMRSSVVNAVGIDVNVASIAILECVRKIFLRLKFPRQKKMIRMISKSLGLRFDLDIG
jgi:hypothetical protein